MTYVFFAQSGVGTAVLAELVQKGIVVLEGPTDQTLLGEGDVLMEKLREIEPQQPAFPEETHRGKVVAQWKRERRGRRS